MQMLEDMKQQLMDPGKRGPRAEKTRGKRLSPKEIAKRKKERAKMLRKKKRDR